MAMRSGGVAPRRPAARAGGLDVPLYLGSASTFSMGGFGGYTGRALVVGDTLVPGVPLGPPPVAVPEDVRPQLVHEWEVAVQEGPQPAPSYWRGSS